MSVISPSSSPITSTTKVPPGQVVLLPRATDNSVNRATMANDVEQIPTPTSTAPILPANHSGPTRSLTTTSNEVEDMNDWLKRRRDASWPQRRRAQRRPNIRKPECAVRPRS
ncbi:hypothetical protein V8E54_010822 [Elaphomyces granulatus]